MKPLRTKKVFCDKPFGFTHYLLKASFYCSHSQFEVLKLFYVVHKKLFYTRKLNFLDRVRFYSRGNVRFFTSGKHFYVINLKKNLSLENFKNRQLN